MTDTPVFIQPAKMKGYVPSDWKQTTPGPVQPVEGDPDTGPGYGTVTVYGNGPEGEFPAAFVSAIPSVFRKGARGPDRLVVGFALLESDHATALRNEAGEAFYAVAVCNVSKGNSPKSKPYKIRDAMLMPGELSDIAKARGLPGWRHYAEKLPDGSERIMRVRVQHRMTNGRRVSVVSAICRPGTDDQWIDIEGKFEGPAKGQDQSSITAKPVFPFWLNADGTKRKLKDEDFKGRISSGYEYYAWQCWPRPELPNSPWRTPEGKFNAVSTEALKELTLEQQIDHEIAKVMDAIGMERRISEKQWGY